jgi:ribulose-phosphate 3-epimerase
MKGKRVIKIAPSILSADFSCLYKEMKEIEDLVDMWHVDVMDGHFVPNITIGPLVVKNIKPKTKLPLDVHLMISEPEKFIDFFIEAGSDYITFHVETVSNPEEILSLIKKKGKKGGLSLNPETPLELIEPYLKMTDFILVMSVNPGFGGQKFLAHSVDKIRKLRTIYDGDISVDGGINKITAKKAISAGANILVAGNYIFSSKNRRATVKKLIREVRGQ